MPNGRDQAIADARRLRQRSAVPHRRLSGTAVGPSPYGTVFGVGAAPDREDRAQRCRLAVRRSTATDPPRQRAAGRHARAAWHRPVGRRVDGRHSPACNVHLRPAGTHRATATVANSTIENLVLSVKVNLVADSLWRNANHAPIPLGSVSIEVSRLDAAAPEAALRSIAYCAGCYDRGWLANRTQLATSR